MKQINPHDVFATKYIECYAKLRPNNQHLPMEKVMRMAKDLTLEMLSQELPRYEKVWPEGFKA